MGHKHFVKLEPFEGPLDLLLHLVKVHELDIFDVDVLILTRQYLDYLRMVQFRDLGDAAAFLEMAATLCQMKSAQLLPDSQNDGSTDNEGDDDDTSPLVLQQRLQLLETFKKAAAFFADKTGEIETVGTNHEWARLAPDFEDCEMPLRGDCSTLLVLYEQMMGSLVERRPVRVGVVKETITVAEVINKIKEYIERLRFVMFQDMYTDFSSRYELVANILGILQLTRDRELRIHQETALGPIWLFPDNDIDEKNFFESHQQTPPSPTP